MSKCLVTGGAGFIGSHLVDELIEQDHEVVVIDNLLLGKEKYINDKANFFGKDIRKLEEIKSIFSEVEVVFHLAAEPRLPISIEQPKHAHSINVEGTVNVLESARQQDVDSLIFSSTAAVYGDKEELPISEEATLEYKAPYGLHKAIGEEYSKLYSNFYDLNTVSLRYFNVYGPRKTAEGGYPMVIPIFLQQRQEGKPLTIVGDGKQTRDYVHVDDVVRANIRAWKSDVDNGNVFNIGAGTQVSVNEIAEIIDGESTHIPERKGEIRFSEADISKAKKRLDWEPQVDFEEGIEELKQWWEQNR